MSAWEALALGVEQTVGMASVIDRALLALVRVVQLLSCDREFQPVAKTINA